MCRLSDVVRSGLRKLRLLQIRWMLLSYIFWAFFQPFFFQAICAVKTAALRSSARTVFQSSLEARPAPRSKMDRAGAGRSRRKRGDVGNVRAARWEILMSVKFSLTEMSKHPFSVELMSFDKVEDCGNCDNCVKRKLGETMRSNQVTISTLYYCYTSWKTISWQLVDNQVTISLSKSRHWSTIC